MSEKELFDKIIYIIREKECDAIVALCIIDALIKEYRVISVSRTCKHGNAIDKEYIKCIKCELEPKEKEPFQLGKEFMEEDDDLSRL